MYKFTFALKWALRKGDLVFLKMVSDFADSSLN